MDHIHFDPSEPWWRESHTQQFRSLCGLITTVNGSTATCTDRTTEVVWATESRLDSPHIPHPLRMSKFITVSTTAHRCPYSDANCCSLDPHTSTSTYILILSSRLRLRIYLWFSDRKNVFRPVSVAPHDEICGCYWLRTLSHVTGLAVTADEVTTRYQQVPTRNTGQLRGCN